MNVLGDFFKNHLCEKNSRSRKKLKKSIFQGQVEMLSDKVRSLEFIGTSLRV